VKSFSVENVSSASIVIKSEVSFDVLALNDGRDVRGLVSRLGEGLTVVLMVGGLVFRLVEGLALDFVGGLVTFLLGVAVGLLTGIGLARIVKSFSVDNVSSASIVIKSEVSDVVRFDALALNDGRDVRGFVSRLGEGLTVVLMVGGLVFRLVEGLALDFVGELVTFLLGVAVGLLTCIGLARILKSSDSISFDFKSSSLITIPVVIIIDNVVIYIEIILTHTNVNFILLIIIIII
jgi:hypothetical protein